MTILSNIFTTTANGTFSNLVLDTLADAYNVTIDEADAFIDALVALRLIGEDEDGDLYDIEERVAYDAEEAEAEAMAEQERIDAMQGYCIAAGLPWI